MFKKDNENRDFTRILKAECKKYKMQIREKAFADLILMGWKDKDAYMASGLYNPAYSVSVNDKEMNKLLIEDELFKKYIKITSARIKREEKKQEDEEQIDPSETFSDEELSNSLTKEKQLTELLIAKKKHPIGSKEWLDISKLIADITQAKKDEIKEEDTTIHYYLPLSCDMCELYLNSKKYK